MLKLSQRKKIRARIIRNYVVAAGYPGVVVFTCGNAAEALRAEGLDVVEISPAGDLIPGKWWQPEEIHDVFPHLFDATNGHLPVTLMVRIAHEFVKELGDLVEPEYEVATGSGETIICLRMAYPQTHFIPVYNIGFGTEFEPDAPLNAWVFTGMIPASTNVYQGGYGSGS